MPWSEPTQRVAELRAWFELAAQRPEQALPQLEAMAAVAGDLFDEGNLDGRQYAAVADLARSLREAGTAQSRQLARECLTLIG